MNPHLDADRAREVFFFGAFTESGHVSSPFRLAMADQAGLVVVERQHDAEVTLVLRSPKEEMGCLPASEVGSM